MSTLLSNKALMVFAMVIVCAVLVAAGFFFGYQFKNKENKNNDYGSQNSTSSTTSQSINSTLQVSEGSNPYDDDLAVDKEFSYQIVFSENGAGQKFQDMTNYNTADVKRFYKYHFAIENYPHTSTFVEEYTSEDKAKERVENEINFRIGAWPEYTRVDKDSLNETKKMYGNVEVVERTLQEYANERVLFGDANSFPWRIAIWRKENLVFIHYWSERDFDANPEKYIPLFIGYFQNQKLHDAKNLPEEINGNKVAYYGYSDNTDTTEPQFREEVYYTDGKNLFGFTADTISNNPDYYCQFSGMIPAGGPEYSSSSYDSQKLTEECINELKSEEKFNEKKRTSYEGYDDAVLVKSYEDNWDCKFKDDGNGYCINKDNTIDIYLRFSSSFSASMTDNFMKEFFSKYNFKNING